MHSSCLDPPMSQASLNHFLDDGDKVGFVAFCCQSCKSCESRGRRDENFGVFDHKVGGRGKGGDITTVSLCMECTKGYVRGCYCGICKAVYGGGEEKEKVEVEMEVEEKVWGKDESTMICCDTCQKYVHAACTSLPLPPFSR